MARPLASTKKINARDAKGAKDAGVRVDKNNGHEKAQKKLKDKRKDRIDV